MENNDYFTPEKYLNDEFSEAEKLDFEQKLQSDLDLREQLKLHQLATEAIRIEGRAALKNRLQNRPFSPPPTVFFSRNMAFLCCFLAVVGFLFWWKLRPNSMPVLEKKEVPSELPKIEKTLEKPRINPEIAQKSVEKLPKPQESLNTNQLFAANFRPFKNEEITGLVRSEDTPDSFQKMLDAYLKNNHSEALLQFENLSKADKTNENMLFLKANSLLAVGQTDAAIFILEDICTQKTTNFLTAAQWYLALAYLQKGDRKMAEQELLFIKTAANGQHPFAKNAAQLLKIYSTNTKPAQ